LLVSLTTNDDALSALAFDALASKPLPDQSLAALIEVIRAIPQADKGRAARIAAALSFESKLSDEELSNALRGLQASGAMQSVIGSALKSSSARVVNELLQQYGTQISSGLILDVLKHPDPKVRIKGIEILSVTGSLVAQNNALDLYLKEKDADVLAAYKRVLQFEGSAPAH
jgi:hypothetical protein